MIEYLNQQALRTLSASPALDASTWLCAYGLAQWLVVLPPAALALLWVFGGERDRASAVASMVASLLALLLAQVASAFIVHQRPFMVEPALDYVDRPPDSSFPSDHVALFFALALSAFLMRPPSFPKLWVVVVLGGLVVGWAQIFLGAHSPLDVAGSLPIAALAASVVHSPWGAVAILRLTGIVERFYGISVRVDHRLN